MGAIVYILCTLTAGGCAWTLLQAFRNSRTALLLWSAVCFGFLTASNALISVDLLMFPGIDLFTLRNAAALLGLAAMLYGLIWESR